MYSSTTAVRSNSWPGLYLHRYCEFRRSGIPRTRICVVSSIGVLCLLEGLEGLDTVC